MVGIGTKKKKNFQRMHSIHIFCDMHYGVCWKDNNHNVEPFVAHCQVINQCLCIWWPIKLLLYIFWCTGHILKICKIYLNSHLKMVFNSRNWGGGKTSTTYILVRWFVHLASDLASNPFLPDYKRWRFVGLCQCIW